MQYLNTNAADFNAVLIAIRNFLAANGWTTLVDGTGGGGLSLEMTNANSHDFKITGTKTATPTDYNTGVFTDRYAELKFQKSDIGLAAGYTATPAESNDCIGPFANVWLFTDDAATYCHVMLQTAASRYTHFSFGDLDPKGVHAINVPYCMGMYWEFWQDRLNYLNGDAGFNDPENPRHNVGVFAEDTPNGKAMRVGLPTGVVDPALGFSAVATELTTLKRLSFRYRKRVMDQVNATGFFDYFTTVGNQTRTGGVPIVTIPVLVFTGTVHTYIGEVPTMGICSMTGLSPGQVLTFAGDDWIVFPLKQYGLQSAAEYGTAPQPVCNSWNYGIAIKKTGV